MRKLVSRLRGSKFVRDTLFLQSVTGVSLITGLASMSALQRGLGSEGYGSWTVVIRTQEVLALLLSLGLVQATVSRLGSAVGACDGERVRDLMAFLARASLLLNGAAAVVAALLAPLVARWLLGETDPTLGRLAALLMLLLPLGIPARLVTVALSGSRRMEELSYFENLASVVRLAFVLVGVGLAGLLVPEGGWRAVACIVGARLVAAVVNSVLALSLYAHWRGHYQARGRVDVDLPSMREIFARVRRVSLRQDLPFSIRVGLDKNLAALVAQVPFWLLGHATSEEERLRALGALQAAMRILSFPIMALGAVSRNTLLKLGERQGADDARGAWRVFRQVTLVSGGFSLVAVIPLALLAPWIIRIVSGAGFEAAVPCLRILALYGAVQGFATGLGALFIVHERILSSMLLKVIGVALVLPLGLWLLREMQAPELAVALYHVAQQAVIVLAAFVFVSLTLAPRRDGPPPPDPGPPPPP